MQKSFTILGGRRIASPICLPPDSAKTFSGEVATTVGWGVTEDGKPSKYLRQVSINVENAHLLRKGNYRYTVKQEVGCTAILPLTY